MNKTHTQRSWQLEMSKAPNADARRELIRKLNKGEVEVIDEAGKPISFTPPPDRLEPWSHPLPSQRDSSASSAKLDAAPVTKGFSLSDRAAFESCIADEPFMKKVELRIWFDAKRKEEGLD